MMTLSSELGESFIRVIDEHLASFPYVVDGTGILMAVGQWEGIPPGAWKALWLPITEIQRLRAPRLAYHVMVNVIKPGVTSGIHVDPEPLGDTHFERWHLPVSTNPGCIHSEGGVDYHLPAGKWSGPVEYWTPHCARNEGKTPRTHVIVDLLPGEAK